MLELAVANGDPLEQAVDLLLIGCGERDLEGPGIAGRADAKLDGLLHRAAAEERFAGKPGQSLLVHTHGALPARRIALIGLGASAADDTRALRSAAGGAVRIAGAVGAVRAALTWPVDSGNGSLAAAAEGAWLGGYRFDRYSLTCRRPQSRSVSGVAYALSAVGAFTRGAAAELARARITTRAVARARDLGRRARSDDANAPGSARQRVGRAGGSLGRGPQSCRLRQTRHGPLPGGFAESQEEPRFIHLAWKPPGARRRLVLVGKGVTFDSGGLSLKTNEGMLDMKTDMASMPSFVFNDRPPEWRVTPCRRARGISTPAQLSRRDE